MCGYPDGTNTGTLPGAVLRSVPDQVSRGRGWYYDPRGWVEVDGNGAVLEGLSIPYNLDISASHVTVSNVRITVSGDTFGVSLRHTSDVTIENSDISSPSADAGRLLVGIKDVYGDSVGTRILRDNIWHAETGIQVGEGLIEDNYIHATGYQAGDHTNGITVNGGSTPLTILHNTVFVDRGQTDAIGLFEDFGTEANKVITGNLLAGGGYTIYGGQGKDGPATNIRITGNRISTLYYANGGYYGYLADFDPTATGNVWSGNIWDRSGQPVSVP